MKYLLLADLHGNREALKRIGEQENVRDVDRVIIAGDLLGGFHSRELLDMVAEMGALTICGNSEMYLRSHLEGEEKYDSLRWAPVRFNRSRLSDGNLRFIKQLPKNLTLTDRGRKIFVSHADPENRYELFYPERNRERVKEILSSLETQVFITAHSHKQWNLCWEGTHGINPGSVGYSFSRGGKTDYAILEMGDEIEVGMFSIDYDMDRYVSEILAAGYLEETGPMGRAVLAMMKSGEPVSRYFFRHINEVYNRDGAREIDDELLRLGEESFNWEDYGL
ncbi:MAG: metallophosphoesterase family protein [Spirochaetales bacterium]|nr:metallophosphoesterase family protein [Spirochaetales bacterium]